MTPKPTERRAKIVTRALRRNDWGVVERLFGSNGACGGCWCMWWRVPKGGAAWERAKGEVNRRAFRTLVESGAARGVLAFESAEPVGWCCVGARSEFPRAERVKAIKSDWDAATWSVTCFFIPARARGRGVARALLAAAIEMARKGGARTLEGYPVRATGNSRALIPAAFAWTGVVRMFEGAGFERAGPRGARELWTRRLAPARARARRTMARDADDSAAP